MAEQNYGELFCEAVDTLIKLRLQGVSFDSTILCTIVDDSKKDEGLYVVSDGSTKFQAYSTVTTYRNDNNVYVLIPQGDWNAQKFIVGKKNNSEIEETFTYKKPFSSFVDITTNLIKLQDDYYSLIANNTADDTENNTDKTYKQKTIWSYNGNNANDSSNRLGPNFTSYTRLGILANFRSWLNPFTDTDGVNRYVNQGEYGLKLRILVVEDSINDEKSKPQDAYYELVLNTEDMNGNAYNFQTYYLQEKVFDISSFKEIKHMELIFYQVPGSFKDESEKLLPHKVFLGGLPLGHKVNDNLFVKDVFISLGYSVNDFDTELVNIYAVDTNTTYNRAVNEEAENHKKIELRWIRKDKDGTYYSVDKDRFSKIYEDSEYGEDKNTNEDPNEKLQVRWYRYSLGQASADRFSDVYWKALSVQDGDDDTEILILDADWKDYNDNLIDSDKDLKYYRIPGFFSTWLLPNVALAEEKIKAIIVYNGKPYRSNILTFTNEDEVVSRPTVDSLEALTINCEDGTYGNYRIYAAGNQLINKADASVERKFKLYFKSEYEGTEAIPSTEINDKIVEGFELVEARNILWTIPKKNTMIRLNQEILDYIDNSTEDNIAFDEEGTEYWSDDNNYYIKYYGSTESTTGYLKAEKYDQEVTYYIKEAGIFKIAENVTESNFSNNTYYISSKYNYSVLNWIPYYINSYYSEQLANNTVTCTIEKEKNTFFTAVKELTFGIAGTTGTDVTLVIDFKTPGVNAIDISDEKNNAYTFVANLYDSENKNVTELAKAKNCIITWGLANINQSKPLEENSEGKFATENNVLQIENSLDYNSVEVRYIGSNNEINKDVWNILICKITGWGDYDLIAYLPIPLKKDSAIVYMQGASEVIYNAEGIPSYYKGPYKLFDENNRENEENKKINWEIPKNKLTAKQEEEYQEAKINIEIYEKQIEECQAVIDKYKEYYANTDDEKLKELYKVIIDNRTTEKDNANEELTKAKEKKTEIDEIKKTNKKFSYYPSITIRDNELCLLPLNLYIEDSVYGINVLGLLVEMDSEGNTINTTTLWSLPLLIIQNRYPSAMLNAWDGQLLVDEANNAILAAKIAAGKKNDDNTFSGVLMGDVAEDIGKDTSGITGIYGFHNGEISFAFKESGTGYIGKSGRGRIEFNGDDGVIKSANWISDSNGEGMKIDLDNAIIDMKKMTKSSLGRFILAGINDITDFEKADKEKLYCFYDYTYESTGGYDSSKEYYTPYSYEEIQITDQEYNTLMTQIKPVTPRFYTYYEVLKYLEANTDDGIGENGELTPDFEYGGGEEETPWWDGTDYGDASTVYSSEFKYEILTTLNLDAETIAAMKRQEYTVIVEEGESKIKYLGPEYKYYPTILNGVSLKEKDGKFVFDPPNIEVLYSIYIPSSFRIMTANDPDNTPRYTKTNEAEPNNFILVEEKTYNDSGEVISKTTLPYDPTATYYIERYGKNENELEKDRYITITAEDAKHPLSIGTSQAKASRNFRVEWDGTVHIENGYFGGKIDATSGTLGNLTVYGTLSGGIISGALISGSTIKGSSVNANYLYCNNGKIGGWNIGANYLRAGQITLDSASGSIIGGTIRGSSLYSSSGEIGGWIIQPGMLYGGKRNPVTGSGGTTTSGYKYAIELNSQLGAIRGGIILTNYTMSSDTPDTGETGSIKTLGGKGTILDGFFSIANPTGNFSTPPSILRNSYLGYIEGNIGDSLLSSFSSGIGMIMGDGAYITPEGVTVEETSEGTASDYSLVLASNTGVTLLYHKQITTTTKDENENEVSDTENKSNSIVLENSGIKLEAQTFYGTSSNKIENITDKFSARDADGSFYSIIASKENATTEDVGKIIITANGSISLDNTLADNQKQYIHMGKISSTETVSIFTMRTGNNNETSDGGDEEDSIAYIEIFPGFSIGGTANYSSSSIRIEDESDQIFKASPECIFVGWEDEGRTSASISPGYLSVTSAGTGVSRITSIDGGDITADSITINEEISLSGGGVCNGLYVVLA